MKFLSADKNFVVEERRRRNTEHSSANVRFSSGNKNKPLPPHLFSIHFLIEYFWSQSFILPDRPGVYPPAGHATFAYKYKLGSFRHPPDSVTQENISSAPEVLSYSSTMLENRQGGRLTCAASLFFCHLTNRVMN